MKKPDNIIKGINHITLSVKKIDVSFDFYVNTIGLKPVARWNHGAYLLAGDIWIALIVEENIKNRPSDDYTHIAFSVSDNDFSKISKRIENYGAEIWQENKTEGKSLYFLDPDGYKFEIHTSNLKNRIKSVKENPRDEIKFFN